MELAPALCTSVEVHPVEVAADGFWSAVTAAADGNIYIGTCKHGGSAPPPRYEPGPDRMTSVGLFAGVTRGQWSGNEPQAKIHVRLLQGRDGRLYFATHLGNFWYHARESERAGFPGSHWVAYDPATGTIADLGVAAPCQGVICMALDSPRDVLYGMTFPRGHLLQYRVGAGHTRDLGRISNWDSVVRSLVTDDAGRVYGSAAPNRIFRYDPQTDAIERLPTLLPHRDNVAPRPRGSTTGAAIWRTAFYHEGHRKIYGIHAGGTDLFEFSVDTGAARLLAPMCPDEFVGRDAVPYASLALVRGRGDVLFYGAQGGASRFDYAATESAGPGGPRAHLVTYDLAAGRRKDHGPMIAASGEYVLGTEGAAVDAAGTVYFAGLVQRPGAAARIALIIYRQAGRKAKP
jgi:hypothetical protein